MSTPSGSATKPLGYSYLISEEILHSPIPADPNYPTHPAPEFYDSFVFAMGIGWPDAMYANVDPVDVPLQQTVVGRGGVVAHGLERSGATDTERKPGWTYNFPAGTSIYAIVNKAFAAFNNYGPIPVDQEDTSLVWSWDPSDNIKRERRVFFYQTTVSHDGRDADFDLVMALYGQAQAEDSPWIYPEKNGQAVRALLKRGPNEWVSLFDLYAWMNENGELIQQAILIIATVAISVVTVGLAAPAMAGFYIAMQAVLAGMKMLAVAIQTGDVALAIKAVIKVGQAMQGASSSLAPEDTRAAAADIEKKFKDESKAFVAWGEQFAAPITKLYTQAQTMADQGSDKVDALVKLAEQQARSFPAINADYWKNAFAKENVGAAVQMWATRAQGLSKTDLANYVASVPWYAREAAGFGAAIRAAEIVQQETPVGGGMHFGSIYQPAGGQGVLQLRADLAPLVHAIWPSPDDSLQARKKDLAAFAKNPGSFIPNPQFTATSTPAKVVIGAGLAAVLIVALKDYAFGRVLDKLLNKVIP